MLPEFCSLVSVPCSRDTFSPIETLHSFGWYCNPEGCVLFETFALFVTVFSQLPLTFASSSAPGRLINSSETSKTTNSAKKNYTRSKLDKRYCTAPQMIPDCKWSPDRKWSPNWTVNDPEPQMIPNVDRKLSRRKTRNGMEFVPRVVVSIFNIQKQIITYHILQA